MIYILIPVFNEEENLPILHHNLVETLTGTEKYFVFVDDGSSDKSVSILNALFEKEQFIVLGDGKNHGPGYAFNAGMEWILARNIPDHDLVVTMEADNTSDINILPHMISIAGMGFQLVLASPYAQGGGFTKTSFLRKVLSFGANMLFRTVFDIKVLTLSSFYRVYSAGLLRSIKNKFSDIITESGYLCKLEILIKSLHVQATVIEVPMKLHSDKRRGKSKMKLFRTSMDYIRFLLFKKI